MNNDEIYNKICITVESMQTNGEIPSQLKFRELGVKDKVSSWGLDSIGMVSLVIRLEEVFNIELDEDTVTNMTITELINCITLSEL